MSVQVLTDSASCLPPDLAEAAGVTVARIHVTGQGAESGTSGLSALELTAAYARLLERGGDAGVVALHLSKELSATWSNAQAAAGVFPPGLVQIPDTQTAGMVLGFAALAAAEVARSGGSLDEVAAEASRVVDSGRTWLYIHKLDAMRRGGRLSAGQALLSTALAIKPILLVGGGKLEVAAKTRTHVKAMDRLVALVRAELLEQIRRWCAELDGDAETGADVAARAAGARGPGRAGEGREADAGSGTHGAGQEAGATAGTGKDGAERDGAEGDRTGKDGAEKDGAERDGAERDGARAARTATDAATDGPVTAARRQPRFRIAVHRTAEAEGAARTLTADLEAMLAELSRVLQHGWGEGAKQPKSAREWSKQLSEITTGRGPGEVALPEVDIVQVELSPAVAVHAGPGALGVSTVVV